MMRNSAPYRLSVALSLFCCLAVSALAQDVQRDTSPRNAQPGAPVRGRVVYADTGHPVRLASVRLIRMEEAGAPAREE